MSIRSEKDDPNEKCCVFFLTTINSEAVCFQEPLISKKRL